MNSALTYGLESLPLKPILDKTEGASSYGGSFFGQNSVTDTGNRPGLFTLFCPQVVPTKTHCSGKYHKHHRDEDGVQKDSSPEASTSS